MLHHAQENAQGGVECSPVTLQKIAQTLGYRQHPLAHGRAALEDHGDFAAHGYLDLRTGRTSMDTAVRSGNRLKPERQDAN